MVRRASLHSKIDAPWRGKSADWTRDAPLTLIINISVVLTPI